MRKETIVRRHTWPFVVLKLEKMQYRWLRWPLYVFKQRPVEQFHSRIVLIKAKKRKEKGKAVNLVSQRPSQLVFLSFVISFFLSILALARQ